MPIRQKALADDKNDKFSLPWKFLFVGFVLGQFEELGANFFQPPGLALRYRTTRSRLSGSLRAEFAYFAYTRNVFILATYFDPEKTSCTGCATH